MTTLHFLGFKKTLLTSVVGLCLSQGTYALEEISDTAMSQTTGEGIALLPTDFSFQLNGANSINSTASSKTNVTDNSNPGTGYIHIIPVGPLSPIIQAANANAANKIGKADVYLYGLALSKDDGNVNTRYSGQNISSWGTAANPWVFKVQTASGIPNFAGTAKDVSYLNLEAPLYNRTGTSDDYNLKLGLWADAFVRDPARVEGNASEFCLNAAADCKTNTQNMRPNRLRLQGVLNGFSVNGSNVKLFQTLDGSNITSYNNTVGLAALIRLNSNDSANSVLRLSTQEIAASQNAAMLLNTPAIDGGAAPSFNANEGIYLYKPHINLALGSLYQPLVLGVADDNKNIVLELTRIPNSPNVYNQIYTDYSANPDPAYRGSTCSQFECGGSGKNPTHSSITVGDVAFNQTTKSITTTNLTNTNGGVTFRDGTGTAVNLGSAAIDGVLIQHLKMTTKGL